MPASYDVAVIGAGPGGYVAAIRCAQLGLSTVSIDDWRDSHGQPSLGGTCLNVGCIPSKALLESSENYARLRQQFGDHGIRVDGARIDVAAMLARKDGIVKKFSAGIDLLFRKHRITALHGRGRLIKTGDPWQIEVRASEGVETIGARHVIIATGSSPRKIPGVTVDNDRIVDNVGALAFNETPARLGIIGAGVVGLELGSVWRRLGAEVSLLESRAEFLPAADEQIAKEALRVFGRQGLTVRLGTTIDKVAVTGKQVNVEYRENGAPQRLACDRLIVAVGRSPNSRDLGAEQVGLTLDDRGFIEVDERCRTNLPNVYAIGDVVRGPMLAHKASEEGMLAAECIAGQAGQANYAAISSVIYTAPEIAWVGMTGQALRQAGVEFRQGVFPFSANGRAQALSETAGFVKILADANTDRVLGVHILGAHASELIAEAVVALEYAASSEDLARIVHAHPSLSEALHEAALGVAGRAIHI
jgi:dihydrolipoamide dehydrogenase